MVLVNANCLKGEETQSSETVRTRPQWIKQVKGEAWSAWTVAYSHVSINHEANFKETFEISRKIKCKSGELGSIHGCYKQ